MTGLSCPIFGIQWTAPVDEVKLAEQFVIFLEDKRVLFNPSHMEDSGHCVSSVNCIRDEITSTLQQVNSKSPLSKSLRRMRSASLVFQNAISPNSFSTLEQPIQNSILERELFKLREKVGLSLGEITVLMGSMFRMLWLLSSHLIM
ncbi:DUF6650 family protein [Vibrio cyclitrophicus]|uniref:DUF6650 family protein n=1 Tax=Vibrio cyclitrophicus TaxID=47951 RepID=UPI0030D5418E